MFLRNLDSKDPIHLFFTMRLFIPLFALASLVSSAVVEKRQLLGLYGGPVTKPDRIEDIAPRVRPDAKRQKIRFGPFTLPAMVDKPKGPGGLLDRTLPSEAHWAGFAGCGAQHASPHMRHLLCGLPSITP